ncbi:MAG: hypothetical protein WDO68_12315 [Gammaproteobacteria bacterium]
MEPIVQALIVAILVIASAVLATWRLMPARAKLRVLDSVKPADGNAVGGWLLRLRRGVLAELTHGCGSCSQASDHVQKHAAPKRS